MISQEWVKFLKKQYPAPKKRFQSLEAYRDSFIYFRLKHKNSVEWPCIHCAGRGGYRDPNDCDPVEGYKLAPLYKCKGCKGTGSGPRKDVQKLHRETIDKWKKEKEHWKETREKVLKAMNKLKADDLELLRGLFNNPTFL